MYDVQSPRLMKILSRDWNIKIFLMDFLECRCSFPTAPSPPFLSLEPAKLKKLDNSAACAMIFLCVAAICLPNLQRKLRSTGSSMKRWWPRQRREVSVFRKAIDMLFSPTASKELCCRNSRHPPQSCSRDLAYRPVRSEILCVKLHSAVRRAEGCSEEEKAAGGSLQARGEHRHCCPDMGPGDLAQLEYNVSADMSGLC